MPKFCGVIGFSNYTEVDPDSGIWVNKDPLQRTYRGDILRSLIQNQNGDKINGDISLCNDISIIADPYALENSSSMIYVIYKSIKWKINSVEINFPRMILRIGGVYNGH